MRIVLLPHAEQQLRERKINLAEIKTIFKKPDQIIDGAYRGRKIAQKIIKRNGKKFLYRVIFKSQNLSHIVITAYRTSKIEKYTKGK